MASSLAADSLLEIMSESAKQLGIGSLKEKQIDAISSFVLGHDTFVSLPTGYGKSVIYAALPYIFDILRGELNVCLAFLKIVLQ